MCVPAAWRLRGGGVRARYIPARGEHLVSALVTLARDSHALTHWRRCRPIDEQLTVLICLHLLLLIVMYESL